nr:MAG TPA: hypothetical protein [Caudoviricetes sp.]
MKTQFYATISPIKVARVTWRFQSGWGFSQIK